jgi:hypothetical protein
VPSAHCVPLLSAVAIISSQVTTAVAMYSLIGSASLNGLDPKFYLRTILAGIVLYPVSR